MKKKNPDQAPPNYRSTTIHAKETSVSQHDAKIQHMEILRNSTDFPDFIAAYREKVLSQKTRTIRLLGRKNPARVIHTLLGYEVQASYKRIQCPDLVTARYVRLFSEIGCHSIQLPYDPTITARLIPGFESMLEGVKKKIGELFPQNSQTRQYALQKAYGIIRLQLRDSEK
jgi:hypothetical protein